jgi:hypothetical protein
VDTVIFTYDSQIEHPRQQQRIAVFESVAQSFTGSGLQWIGYDYNLLGQIP